VIVCKQCGHHNEDSDTFCGSCGRFLEWTGERVIVAQPEPEPAPAPEPEPEPARVGFMDRVKQAVGMEDEAPPPPATTVEAPAAPPPLTAVAVAAAPSLNATAAPVAAPEPVLAGVGAPAAPAAVPAGSVDEPVSRRPPWRRS